MTAIQAIPIELIRTDGGTQIRACETFQTKVDEYAEAMASGAEFPPLVVFFDGTDYWLSDGFHRFGAYNICMQAWELPGLDIDCDVRAGDLRDAIMFACGTNAEHGIPRTNVDKRNAVETMLKNPLVSCDEDGTPWSDRAIGRICKVHHSFVGKIRAEVTGYIASERAYTNKHGGQSTMNTANIGGKPEHPDEFAEPEPEPEEDEPPPEPGPDPEDDNPEPDEEEASAPPANAKVIPFTSPWDYLYDRLSEIDRQVAALPDPSVAVREFPTALAHAMPMARVLEIMRWFQEFARLWEARTPEFNRYQQRQRDFVREALNVENR
jgi:hypothetical protein